MAEGDVLKIVGGNQAFGVPDATVAVTASAAFGEAIVDRTATATGDAAAAYGNTVVSADAPDADAIARTSAASATGKADVSRKAEITGGNKSAFADTTARTADGVASLLNIAFVIGTGTAEVGLTAVRGAAVAGMTAISDATSARMGFNGATPVARPEVPAIPTEQDIVDALVALGLITQAA